MTSNVNSLRIRRNRLRNKILECDDMLMVLDNNSKIYNQWLSKKRKYEKQYDEVSAELSKIQNN